MLEIDISGSAAEKKFQRLRTLVAAMILLAGLFQFIDRSHTVGFRISLVLAGLSLFLSEKGLEIWATVPLAVILILMNTFTVFFSIAHRSRYFGSC